MLDYFPARLEQRPSSKSQLFPFSCKQFLVKSSQIPPEGLVDHLKASHAEKNSTARPRVKSIGLCGTEISERLRWNSSTFYAAADILSAYISSRWTQRVRVDSLVVQVVNPYIFVFSYDNTRHCLKRKSKELRRRRSLTYFRGRTKKSGLKDIRGNPIWGSSRKAKCWSLINSLHRHYYMLYGPNNDLLTSDSWIPRDS